MKILAVGNEMRCDDSIALRVAELSRHQVIKAYECPENFIKEGDEVIIIDACKFLGEPGEVRVINDELIIEQALTTTHNPNYSMIKKIANKVILIGIQPHCLDYGSELSPVLLSKLNDVVKNVDSKIDFILKDF